MPVMIPIYIECRRCRGAADKVVRVTLHPDKNRLTRQRYWSGACPECGYVWVDYDGPNPPTQQTLQEQPPL